MNHPYRFSVVALAVACLFSGPAQAGTEAEERAKRQLTLLQQKLDLLQQEITEQDKALKEVNRRNSELTRQLAATRTVVRWIGNNPAAMQKIAEASEAAPTGGGAEAASESAAEPTPDAAEPQGGTPVAEVPAASLKPVPDAPLAAGKPSATGKAKETIDKGESQSTDGDASRWIQAVLDEPLALGGGAAVIGAGLMWWLTGRRRKERIPPFEDSLLAHNTPTKQVVIGSTGGAVIDTTLSMNSMLKEEDLAEASFDPSNIDPVAEAEVYLAYGRDSQAEEILRDALTRMPQRQDVRLKLLDIYASRGDLRLFEATLAEMQQAGINSEDSIWARVVELSAGFGPKNPLGSDEAGKPIASSPVFGADTVSPVSRPAAPVDTIELALVSADANAPVVPSERIAADQPTNDATMAGLAEPFAPVGGDSQRQIAASAVESTVPVSSRINPDTLLDFDFEFDAGKPANDEHGDDESGDERQALNGEIALDFGQIDLDLSQPAEIAGAGSTGSPFSASSPAVLDMDLDVDPESDEDPIDIKISLARAYIDMGDRDSANEILQEVLEEGSASQGKLAREMLDEMRGTVS